MICSGAFDAMNQLFIRMIYVVKMRDASVAEMNRADELRRWSILLGAGRMEVVKAATMEITTTLFHRTLEKLPFSLFAEETWCLSVRLTIGAQNGIWIASLINSTFWVVDKFAFWARIEATIFNTTRFTNFAFRFLFFLEPFFVFQNRFYVLIIRDFIRFLARASWDLIILWNCFWDYFLYNNHFFTVSLSLWFSFISFQRLSFSLSLCLVQFFWNKTFEVFHSARPIPEEFVKHILINNIPTGAKRTE